VKRLKAIVFVVFLALFCRTAPAAQAAITNLQVVGLTATQALISYNAPDSGPCTIQASKFASYSPLIHDVDSSLFPGSNVDNRPGSVGAGGTVRIIVLGKRKSEKAADGNYYSRALQAYTPHYVQITCDNGDQAAINFMTQTIPTGQTYNDPLTSDPALPGQYPYPTVQNTGSAATDRAQEIVDPQTGALIKRINVSEDTWGGGVDGNMYYGATRFCSPLVAADSSGNKGFRCLFDGELTFINKETGQVTPLGGMVTAYRPQEDGWLAFESCTNWDSVDPNSTDCTQPTFDATGAETRQAIIRATYVGNNQPYSGNLPDCGLNGGTQPCVKWVNLTPGHDTGNGPQDLRSMMNNFDPAFANFVSFWGGFGLDGVTNENFYMTIRNSNQNTLAWFFVFNPGDFNPLHAGQTGGPRMIAATNSYAHAPLRWCDDHVSGTVDASQNWFNGGANSLSGGGPLDAQGHYTAPGLGSYLVNVMTALTSTPGPCPPAPAGSTVSNWPTGDACSVVTVDGEVRNPQNFLGSTQDPTPEPPILQPALPGDYFAFPNISEYVRLLIKQVDLANPTGPQIWTVQRGYGWTSPKAQASGTPITAICGVATVWDSDILLGTSGGWYWDFLNDPHGLNANGATVIPATLVLGHQIYDQQVLIGNGGGESNYGYDIYTGPIPQVISSPVTPIWANNNFDGILGGAYPNVLDSHPSYIVTDKSGVKSFVDGRPWNGGSFGIGDPSTPATNVGGNVWKFAAGARLLHRTQLPTIAFCGPNPLQDISGAGSNISNPPYTYCVVDRAGECRSGSAAGEVYANCPNVAQPNCVFPGIAASGNGLVDLCIGDAGPYMTQLTETSLKGVADTTGAGTRVFTHAFQIFRWHDVFLNPRPLVTPDVSGLASDGSAWMFFATPSFTSVSYTAAQIQAAQGLYGKSSGQVFLVRLPPLPGPSTLARNDFLPTAVTVPPPPSGVASDNAVVQFGYAENGAASKLYCTSRQEACVKGAQTGNSYNFLSDTVSGVPCAGGCTITLPMIPQRAMYYQVQYRSGSGIVASGPLQVITEPYSAPAPTGTAPSITQQPAGQTAMVGQTATFSVNANGTAPLTYQWFNNGLSITNAVSSSYTTPATYLIDSGAQFTVTISNATNTPVTSSAADLTVNPLPPPVLQVPSEIPVNGTINIDYPYPAGKFVWIFTPEGSATQAQARTSSGGAGGALTITTGSPKLDMSLQTLQPGAYMLTFQVYDLNNDPAGSASAPVTLVPVNVSAVNVYPNPFRASRGDSAITFAQQPAGCSIKLFTVSGRWVQTLAGSSGKASWNLRNSSGEPVASGIYLYLITDAQGNKIRGKLAIIR